MLLKKIWISDYIAPVAVINNLSQNQGGGCQTYTDLYTASLSKGDVFMYSTVQKWGNSQGIRIPKKILDSVNIKNNELVKIEEYKGYILIKKAVKEYAALMNFLRAMRAIINPLNIILGKM